MALAVNGIIPPKEWYHDPTLKSNNGETVAILLINHGSVPPKEWLHDPSLRWHFNGFTVAMLLYK